MIKRTTWVVLAFFIVILIASVLFQRNRTSNEEEATPTPNAEFLIDKDTAEISFLSVEDNFGSRVELALDENGTWNFVKPESAVVDTAALESIINQFSTLREIKKISPVTNWEDFGLDQPSFTIQIGFSDGKILPFQVGSLTPTDSGYYVGVDQNEVLVINKLGIESITNIILNPPILEPTASPPNS